jgi:hypothetical protein
VTTTRRRLAVVTTTTLALLGGLAGSAWAGTSINAGCNGGRDVHQASSPDEVPLSHTMPSGDTFTVTPSADRIAGSVSVSTTSGIDACGMNGGYTELITIRSAHSEIEDGDEVVLLATLRFAADVAASGTGSSAYAEAWAAANVTIEGLGGLPESGVLLAASADLQGGLSGGEADHTGSFVGFGNTTAEDPVTETTGGATGTGAYTTEQHVPFTAVVGDTMRLSSDLHLYSGTTDTASAAVDVQHWELVLTAFDGVVLDRGDAPQPEPQPEPEPEPEPGPVTLPSDLIQQAREALAGYGLSKGIANSFDVKLRAAQEALASGESACDELASFQNHLSALTGKKISEAQAEEIGTLVAQAQELLGC